MHPSTQEGVSPLMNAIRRSDLEMVNVLVEGGADISAQNEVNYTAVLSRFHVFLTIIWIRQLDTLLE